MQIQFGGFDFRIPDGWRNQSTLLFTLPPPETAPLMAQHKQSGGAPASLSLTWEESKAPTLDGYIEERLALLKKALQRFELKERGDLGAGGEPIAFAEYAFEAPIPLVQMLCVRRIGAWVLCVTGTALPSVFPTVREKFVETVQGVRAE